MKFKYIKGTETDFDGAPEWVIIKTEYKWYGFIDGVMYYSVIGYAISDRKSIYQSIDDILVKASERIIAQREPITESELWFEKGELPPVGEKVECHMTSWCDKDKWIETSLIYAHDDKIWIDGSDSIFPTNKVIFRPLKTKEQKEKEEITSALCDIWNSKKNLDLSDVASKLYDMGWRKVDK